MKPQILIFIAVCSCFAGCVGRQAYYVSPLNGLTSQYRSTPMKMDSIKSATYVNASLSAGGANEGLTDSKYSFSAGLSRSHNFGMFQARYGSSLTLGAYHVTPYDTVGNHSSVNYQVINNRAGKYSFGAAAFDGGINFTHTSGNSEWRVLGLETSLFHEFGKYAQMRKDLPDSSATIIVRSRFFGTVGVFTELLGKAGESEIGGKFGFGRTVGRAYHNNNVPDSWFFGEPVHFSYLTFVLHYGRQNWKGFFQTIMGGKSASAVFGMNFRLGK
jgi:hypothetical protein